MNRKQKIIVSTTGIFLVLLILVGLTYAYFLTRINENTNDKSISVSTANLELTYGDNSAEILGKDLVLEPSDKEIGTKTFTVTNNGNLRTNYVVIIEDVIIKNTSDNIKTTFESNDFRYTLTCTKKDGTKCVGVNEKSVFPINGGVLIGNNIDPNDIETYKFTMYYIDTGLDQSNDMGKTLQAKINITNTQNLINIYSYNEKTLAYNIINNARNKTNGTEFIATPVSNVAEETSVITTDKIIKKTESQNDIPYGNNYSSWHIGDTEQEAKTGNSITSFNEAVGKYIYNSYEGYAIKLLSYDEKNLMLTYEMNERILEKVLSMSNDDYGISYYFRGQVSDNYVNFADMCWRIIRIAGDGSIKLILEDQDNICENSDGNWNIPTETGGTIKTGNYGYKLYPAKSLTASDGSINRGELQVGDYLNPQDDKEKSMSYAFLNFQKTFTENELSYLKIGDWCKESTAYIKETVSNLESYKTITNLEKLDKKIKFETFYYGVSTRILNNNINGYNPSFKCLEINMKKFNDGTDMYVGAISADEVAFAGGKSGAVNYNYYLLNNYQKEKELFFLTSSIKQSYGSTDTLYVVRYNGGLINAYVKRDDVSNKDSFRPAINLKSNTKILSSNGLKTNPYTIK